MLGLNSLQCGIFKLKVAKCVLSLYMKGYFHTSVKFAGIFAIFFNMLVVCQRIKFITVDKPSWKIVLIFWDKMFTVCYTDDVGQRIESSCPRKIIKVNSL